MGYEELLRRFFSSACLVIVVSTLGIFLIPTVHAQSAGTAAIAEAGPFPEPAKADNHYYYADREAGTLLPLERQEAKWRNTFWLFAGSGGIGVPVRRSSFRIKSGQEQEFVTRFSPAIGINRSSEAVLSQEVILIPLTSKRNRRELEVVNWRLYWVYSKFEVKPSLLERMIKVKIKAYGDGSAVITPVTPLPPGEYAFWVPQEDRNSKSPVKRDAVFFTFGVDPPDTQVTRNLGSDFPAER